MGGLLVFCLCRALFRHERLLQRVGLALMELMNKCRRRQNHCMRCRNQSPRRWRLPSRHLGLAKCRTSD